MTSATANGYLIRRLADAPSVPCPCGTSTRPLTAADGAAGLALAESERPDAVLIDIGLPEMDGYEVARRLRGSQFRPAVLIALTGYGQPQDRARAEAVGFDLYLVKPVDDRELDALLRKGDRPAWN